MAEQPSGELSVIKILNPTVLAGLTPEERDRLETLFWQEAVKIAKCNGDTLNSHSPQQYCPELSDWLNQAILRGMALESEDRPQSMQE